jgi:hypothetical protein
MITFGKFGLVKKTKTENLKGIEYRLYFEDEYNNKIVVKAEGTDYSEYTVGDPFSLDNLQVQSRLG